MPTSDMDAIDQTVVAGSPTKTWWVDVKSDGRPESRLRVAGSTAVIGRASGCDIRLEDPLVSRGHARLELSPDGRWRITDSGSHNGTLVNGERISTVYLHPGDRVGIGPFTLALHATAPLLRVGMEDHAVVRTLDELVPPRLAVEQLHRLDSFGQEVLAMPDASSRLIALCRLMLDPQFGGLWAVAISISGEDLQPICTPQSQSNEVPILSRTLIRAATTKHKAVVATNNPTALAPSNIEMSISPEVRMLSAVAVPLSDPSDKPVKLLCAGFPPQHGTGEWLALCGLAVRQYRQAEAAWANIAANRKLAALEADLDRARNVQDRLVPKTCSIPGLDVAIRFRPCQSVGGDYVDVIALPNGKALLVIADVSGKGLAAALVAMAVHTVVHASARRWHDLSDLAAALDEHLIESLSPGTFVTLIAMTIDVASGAIESINAGHPPAVVFGADASAQEVAVDGDGVMGFYPQQMKIMHESLEYGQSMLLMTDGCLEVFDEQRRMLGGSDLREKIAAPVTAAPNSAGAADEVMKCLESWQGTAVLTDDRTLILVRRRLNDV